MTDLPSRTDDDLLRRTAQGDREAFATLYREYRADIYRFAAHMCGSSVLAEDVVQDVFVAVIEHATRYRSGRSGVLAWLVGIARNHVRRARCRRQGVPLPEDDSDMGKWIAHQPDVLANLTREGQEAALARALLEVPPRYREAIVLCDLQQLSYEQAASALQAPIGTVRSRLHRGRALLARSLSRTGHPAVCGVPAPKAL